MSIVDSSPIVREYVRHGRSESCPIVDMHGHLGPFHGGYLPNSPLEKMRRSMARSGTKRIVCSAHNALFVDVDYGNQEMQAVIDQYPEEFSGYWMVNPNYPEITARATHDFEHSHGFVGFKFLPDYHTYPVTGNGYAPVLEYADAHRLLVLVHTWGGSSFNSPQQIAEVAARYSGAIFIMGHSGFGDWANAVSVAKDLPNAYLELTAVYAAHDWAMIPTGSGSPVPFASCLQVNGIIEYMVEGASSKKILFGTDLPWYSPHYAAGAVLFARIDDDARHDILHGNAERLLSAFPDRVRV